MRIASLAAQKLMKSLWIQLRETPFARSKAAIYSCVQAIPLSAGRLIVMLWNHPIEDSHLWPDVHPDDLPARLLFLPLVSSEDPVEIESNILELALRGHSRAKEAFTRVGVFQIWCAEG